MLATDCSQEMFGVSRATPGNLQGMSGTGWGLCVDQRHARYRMDHCAISWPSVGCRVVALGSLAGSKSVNSVTGCDFQARAPFASARQAQDCVLVSSNPPLTGAKLQEAFVLA